MAKYSKDLDESLVSLVKTMSVTYGLNDSDIKVDAIRLNKIGKKVGEIVKGTDLVKLYTDRNVVALALCEEAFLAVDEQTQKMWIEQLLSQIYYDSEKEKITVDKDGIFITVGMYNKYKDLAVEKAVLADLTMEQIREKEEERKQQEKLERKNNKKKKEE